MEGGELYDRLVRRLATKGLASALNLAAKKLHEEALLLEESLATNGTSRPRKGRTSLGIDVGGDTSMLDPVVITRPKTPRAVTTALPSPVAEQDTRIVAAPGKRRLLSDDDDDDEDAVAPTTITVQKNEKKPRVLIESSDDEDLNVSTAPALNPAPTSTIVVESSDEEEGSSFEIVEPEPDCEQECEPEPGSDASALSDESDEFHSLPTSPAPAPARARASISPAAASVPNPSAFYSPMRAPAPVDGATSSDCSSSSSSGSGSDSDSEGSESENGSDDEDSYTSSKGLLTPSKGLGVAGRRTPPRSAARGRGAALAAAALELVKARERAGVAGPGVNGAGVVNGAWAKGTAMNDDDDDDIDSDAPAPPSSRGKAAATGSAKKPLFEIGTVGTPSRKARRVLEDSSSEGSSDEKDAEDGPGDNNDNASGSDDYGNAFDLSDDEQDDDDDDDYDDGYDTYARGGGDVYYSGSPGKPTNSVAPDNADRRKVRSKSPAKVPSKGKRRESLDDFIASESGDHSDSESGSNSSDSGSDAPAPLPSKHRQAASAPSAKGPTGYSLPSFPPSEPLSTFARRRVDYARRFYDLLNEAAFGHALPSDLPLIWSKSLQTTAGRAHCGGKLGLRIELAQKVLTSQDKLFSVLAHEMCHIAVFHVDKNMKDGHGPLFRKWGSKVSRVFPGLEVTRCHNYRVNYRFHFVCTGPGCAVVFMRQSRSIDVATAVCPMCYSRLEERRYGADGTPTKAKTVTGYAAYVQEHMAAVSRELALNADAGAGVKRGDVMRVLAERYRLAKERGEVPGTPATAGGRTKARTGPFAAMDDGDSDDQNDLVIVDSESENRSNPPRPTDVKKRLDFEGGSPAQEEGDDVGAYLAGVLSGLRL